MAEITLQISSEDDLVTRAENIVRIMGYRGAIGDYVLAVHKMLKSYAQVDAEKLARMKAATLTASIIEDQRHRLHRYGHMQDQFIDALCDLALKNLPAPPHDREACDWGERGTGGICWCNTHKSWDCWSLGPPAAAPTAEQEGGEPEGMDEDSDEPKTWRDLAESAILDLGHYAHDETPERRLVSYQSYSKTFRKLSTQSDSDVEGLSPSDPFVILAGIKQFGLASDGADIRDLAAALQRVIGDRDRLAKDNEQLREALEKIAMRDHFLGELQEPKAAQEARAALAHSGGR